MRKQSISEKEIDLDLNLPQPLLEFREFNESCSLESVGGGESRMKSDESKAALVGLR